VTGKAVTEEKKKPRLANISSEKEKGGYLHSKRKQLPIAMHACSAGR
jgi:hypothetical protein